MSSPVPVMTGVRTVLVPGRVALGERELRGGWLEVVAQEGGILAVARRVDADTEAARRGRGLYGHRGPRRWSTSALGRGGSREGPPAPSGTRKLVIRGLRLRT